jgi:hypothetical protein
MNVLITFGVVLVISVVIGLVARWLRSVQQNEEQRQAELRANERTRSERTEVDAPRPQRSANSDMERFLEEINKLRNRSGAPAAPSAPPTVRPVAVPVVDPTRRPETLQESLPSSPPVVTAPVKLDSLPGVTYNPTLLSMSTTKPLPLPVAKPVATALPVAKPSGGAIQPDRLPKSEITKQLLTLLKSGKGPALAVLIQEVLGEPKFKRPG